MRTTIGGYRSTPPALIMDQDISVSSLSGNLPEPAPKSTSMAFSATFLLSDKPRLFELMLYKFWPKVEASSGCSRY